MRYKSNHIVSKWLSSYFVTWEFRILPTDLWCYLNHLLTFLNFYFDNFSFVLKCLFAYKILHCFNHRFHDLPHPNPSPPVISALTSGKVFPFWTFFSGFWDWLHFYINFINCELYHLSYIKNFLLECIYSVVFISGVQQSESVIHIHISTLFYFLDSFTIIGH